MQYNLSARRTPRFLQLIDFLFIIVSSVGSLSMIQFVTYNLLPLPACLNLLVFSVVLFVIRFGGHFGGLNFVFKNKLLLGISFLYLWELIQGFIVNSDINIVFVRLIFLFSAYISCAYLYGLMREGKPIGYIIKPYCYYAIYVLVTISVLALIIKTGLVTPFSNKLENNALIADNYEQHVYYFPAYLSVVIQEPSVFWGNMGIPMICGLSHEPQLNSFAVLPAIILIMYLYSRKKMIELKVYGAIILLCLLSTSFTGLVCSVVVIILHILWDMQRMKKYSSVILLALFLFVAFLLFVNLGYYDIFLMYMEVKADFDNAASSGGVSLGILDYIISSNSFLGQGIFCSQDSIKTSSSNNIGYLSSIIIILYYFFLLLTALHNYSSKNVLCHFIGLASVYFCLHSLKYGIVLFKYNYMFYILILLSFADTYRKKIGLQRKYL